VREQITPEFLSTYPEPEGFRRKYAEYIGADPTNIFIANGTDMVIRYVLETFGEPGKEVLTVTPSFEMYRINCSLLGLIHKAVPYEEDLSIDTGKILGAITENTRVVVLVNPANPVGNVYSDEDIEKIRARAEEVGAILMVDEAYHYFCPESSVRSALSHKNVIVTRTFSKLFSIPALRLGVAIAHPDIIHYLRNGQLSFDVNAVALLFGEALLDRPEIIEELTASEREGKDYLCAELSKAGYEHIKCAGNYVLIKSHRAPRDVESDLYEKKILIHAYGNPTLKDYIRVTTGSRRVMEKFFATFIEIDEKK
nr:histidinol-phosphate aminotransferase family protein [Lachnospiraceae bacterium]